MLQLPAVTAFEPQIMDQLLEPGHVLGLPGYVMEDLLFGKHAVRSVMSWDGVGSLSNFQSAAKAVSALIRGRSIRRSSGKEKSCQFTSVIRFAITQSVLTLS